MIDINENLLKCVGWIVIWACCFFIGMRMGKND